MQEHLSHDRGSTEGAPHEHTNLSRAIPDIVPGWYKPQPASPYLVYEADTIRDIQRTLSCPETGVMDEATVTHIKGLQYAMGIPATGTVTEDTAVAIQRLRDRFSSPY